MYFVLVEHSECSIVDLTELRASKLRVLYVAALQSERPERRTATPWPNNDNNSSCMSACTSTIALIVRSIDRRRCCQDVRAAGTECEDGGSLTPRCWTPGLNPFLPCARGRQRASVATCLPTCLQDVITLCFET